MRLDEQMIKEVLLYLKDELDNDFENRLITASTHCDIDSWLDTQLVSLEHKNKINQPNIKL